MIDALAAAAQLGAASGSPVDQPYLLEARQMQALSLAVHIPARVLRDRLPGHGPVRRGPVVANRRPGVPGIAKRWSKVILFAIGVVTGTILSFELGLLWPRWMERFAEVFGLGFSLEGISFFVEAIFIAIYVYGWGEVVNVRPWAALFNDHLWHEFVHMYLAGTLVAGFIVAGVYAFAWLRGRRDRYHRAAWWYR